MGYIYIITNDINNKVYIGQTIHSINRRWRHHKYNVGKVDSALYNDMDKLGIEHFKINILEECINTMLNEREKYYIEKYKSSIYGYNRTTGGGIKHKLDEDILENIKIETYTKSIRYISRKYNLSEYTVRNIREELNSDYININKEFSNKPKPIVMYGLYFENPTYFKSLTDVIKYLKVDRRNFTRGLDKACKFGDTHYKHKWQWASELEIDGKIFRTSFEKLAFMDGYEAYQPNDRKYWIVDGIIDKYFDKNKCNIKKDTEFDIKVCKICGKRISNRSTSMLCISCSQVQAKNKSKKPSKEELEKLLKNLSIKDIANKFKRSESTIYYWVKDYNIKYHLLV